MSEAELLDVLNENGEPTGEIKPRDEVHALGLWHKAARVFIFRRTEEDIEFLVQKRAMHKEANAGKWDIRTGGHVKTGETADEAALGELKDEVGLELNIDDLIRGPVLKEPGSHHVFAATYYLDFKGNVGDLKFNDGEVDEMRWFRAEDIISLTKEHPEEWAGRVAIPETALAFVRTLPS